MPPQAGQCGVIQCFSWSPPFYIVCLRGVNHRASTVSNQIYGKFLDREMITLSEWVAPFSKTADFHTFTATGRDKSSRGHLNLSESVRPTNDGLGATVRAQGHHARWLNCADS